MSGGPDVVRRRVGGPLLAALVGLAVLVVVAALVVWLARPADEPAAAPPDVVPSSPLPHGPCATAARNAFVPATIQVAGVRTKVRPVARTDQGVMGVLPDEDKTEFATDLGGVRAGAAKGRVLLNTHTWPDGSALGNLLLRRLHVGDVVRLGAPGRTACYRVVRRDQVLASAGYPGWDRRTGRPQVAIVVCSGTRLGPGNWTHRTLWFADPYFGGSPPA